MVWFFRVYILFRSIFRLSGNFAATPSLQNRFSPTFAWVMTSPVITVTDKNDDDEIEDFLFMYPVGGNLGKLGRLFWINYLFLYIRAHRSHIFIFRQHYFERAKIMEPVALWPVLQYICIKMPENPEVELSNLFIFMVEYVNLKIYIMWNK